MDRAEFQARTKQLALRAIRLVEALPRGTTASVIGRQVLRSATSVGANYRAACRARSSADMIAKLKIVEEEADETLYWLELQVEADVVPSSPWSVCTSLNERNPRSRHCEKRQRRSNVPCGEGGDRFACGSR
jgi:four helix bundle protein